MKKHLNYFIGIMSSIIILFSTYGCKEKTNPFEIYSGSLTVLQKDAYSNVAGRNHKIFWPPHTTTVFKWNNGEQVQLNHGTSPDEKDADGNYMLETVKVYNFNGTKKELEALEEAYTDAVCDSDKNLFLDLDNSKQVLAKSVLDGLIEYILDDTNNFICQDSNITKQEIVELLINNKISEFLVISKKCNWDLVQWEKAFETVLVNSIEDLGHNLEDYHVCNNDADLQVQLIKNFQQTGKIEMPEKKCVGPMIFYFPN